MDARTGRRRFANFEPDAFAYAKTISHRNLFQIRLP